MTPEAGGRDARLTRALQFAAEVFSSLNTERTARKMYRTRDQAKVDVFDYIECLYNPKRRHSTIVYLSPVEFEMRVGFA
jgi:putative transposase